MSCVSNSSGRSDIGDTLEGRNLYSTLAWIVAQATLDFVSDFEAFGSWVHVVLVTWHIMNMSEIPFRIPVVIEWHHIPTTLTLLRWLTNLLQNYMLEYHSQGRDQCWQPPIACALAGHQNRKHDAKDTEGAYWTSLCAAQAKKNHWFN
jgi:hypothetical protein